MAAQLAENPGARRQAGVKARVSRQAEPRLGQWIGAAAPAAVGVAPVPVVWTGVDLNPEEIAPAVEASLPLPAAETAAHLAAPPVAAAAAQRGPAAAGVLPAWEEVPEAVAVPAVAAVPVVAAADGGNGAMIEEKTMKAKRSIYTEYRIILAVLMVALFCIPVILSGAPQQSNAQAVVVQKGFQKPQEAAKALISAAEKADVPALLEILGPEGKDLVSSQDPVQDRNKILAFAARAHEKLSVDKDPSDKNRYIISVGIEDWPLPIPIVKREGKWYLDSKAGHDEIIYRRIGENELNAIQVCRGVVEAQRQYASTIHDNSGIHQYAQKLISTPGKQDGLYWENADGTAGGPVTKGVAKAIEAGYSLAPGSTFGGYYFRLLKGQGPAAPLGELDYVIKGMMIGGFAIIATPAEYRVTGVQTFIVSHDGIVYQKDLGPDTIDIAKKIERYNPDETWNQTDD
jgi:hypothetical protein